MTREEYNQKLDKVHMVQCTHDVDYLKGSLEDLISASKEMR